MKTYYVYIMNSPTGTLYTGMTNDLKRRVYEHKQKLTEGFTKKYNVTRLAYYDQTSDVQTALVREKEIKKWRRSKKIALIKTINPKWQDLSAGWYDEVTQDLEGLP
jgi:putative endonuclease